MIKLLKQIQNEVKFGVIGIDILMTIYVLWLIITNTATWIVGVLFGFTPFGVLELFRASKLFGLCRIHKAMLVHTTLVYFCCVYLALCNFGIMLPFMRWIMFLFGFMLILILLFKTLIKYEHP